MRTMKKIKIQNQKPKKEAFKICEGAKAVRNTGKTVKRGWLWEKIKY